MLFVHKKEFALNYAKLTSDLPVNVVMGLNREEIFESEGEEDDDETEEFQESSGDEVVIINELKRDGKNQECIDVTSSIHHSLTNDPEHWSKNTELWSTEELMEIDTYMDLVQEYKEDGECSGSDVNMIELLEEPTQTEEQILKAEIQAGEMKDIGSYQLPEKHPYKLKPEEIPLYDHNSRRRIKNL